MKQQGNLVVTLAASITIIIGLVMAPIESVLSYSSIISELEKPAAITAPEPPAKPKVTNQIECLAKNIYFEARGEPVAGQVAVGLTTINRTKSRYFPDTICEVVYQRGQFSWTADGNSDNIRQLEVYSDIYSIAELLYTEYSINDSFPDLVEGATHFHTSDVDPSWRNKELTVSIGNHNFYKVGG